MVSAHIENALNGQIEVEARSSQYYLSMASWADTKGFSGVSQFLYRHSDEERQHMLKLIHYVNERGGKAVIPSLDKPPSDFDSIQTIFKDLFEHEQRVTRQINEVVDACLKEKDYTTHNFMQWYVSEQIEEEALARNILDKLALIGNDKGGLYLFDRELGAMQSH
ncbi:MAG: ferritin [Cryomorphaceae bacterium]|nr:ferritin [Flavobacteriales bacterium]